MFIYRDPDMCRAQFHDTPGHAYQNYQAQIRLSVKIAFLAGLARRLTEAIGTTNIPSVSEQLGMLAAQVGMVNAMLSGMEASGSQLGEWYVPNKHFMYSAQVLTQDLYPRVVQTIRRSRRRRADHAAVLRAGFWQSGDGRNHRQDAALGIDEA